MSRRVGMELAIVAVMTGSLAEPAQCEEFTARQIADRALERDAFGFKDAVANLTLTLVSKRGSQRVRRIEIRSKEADALNRTLVRFLAPADVAGTGFLVLENKDADDEQYLYLPALGKVKRITGSQRNQRFMGTDLTYADLVWEALRNAELKRLPDAELAGSKAYVIEAVPQTSAGSEYGMTRFHIRQEPFLVLKVEFFDRALKPLKTLVVKRFEKRQGHWVAIDTTVKNLQAATQTRMEVENVQFDVRLSAQDFTRTALAGG